ncbi:MAG: DNA primase large subunit PriL [archaeon]|nr:DNA primase large subunit PriL [archaeon]
MLFALVDRRLAAKYPFVGITTQIISGINVDATMLISSDVFENSRRRGIQRLEDSINNSEVSCVPLASEYELLTEMCSYLYARIVISCIDNKFLTRRYALSESVRMKKLIEREDGDVVRYIAETLNVNTAFDGRRLRMYFTDYLRLSSRIKSKDWKLVNTEVRGGYVYLGEDKFSRLLQNALQDKIESELPLEIPEEYMYSIREDITYVENLFRSVTGKFNSQFPATLRDLCLPPCIKALLINAQNGVNLSHSGRFALVSFLHAVGMDSNQILKLFSKSPDFDELKSLYQIKHITGELNGTDGYNPPECSTMRTNGICYSPDDFCNNKKINHPIMYYRKKLAVEDRGQKIPVD